MTYTPLPSFVPRSHAPRERNEYILDRTLADVGIDETALNERLANYINWCRGERSRATVTLRLFSARSPARVLSPQETASSPGASFRDSNASIRDVLYRNRSSGPEHF